MALASESGAKRAHSRTLARGWERWCDFEKTSMVGDLYVGNAPGIRLIFPARSRRVKSAAALFCCSCDEGKVEVWKWGHKLCYLKNQHDARANKAFRSRSQTGTVLRFSQIQPIYQL